MKIRRERKIENVFWTTVKQWLNINAAISHNFTQEIYKVSLTKTKIGHWSETRLLMIKAFLNLISVACQTRVLIPVVTLPRFSREVLKCRY